MPVSSRLTSDLRAIFKYGMDQKKFIEKLQEYAELAVVKESRASGERVPDEDTVIERGCEKIVITRKENPTHNVVIKKLKDQIKPCSDCGDLVKNRRVEIKAYFHNIKPHYRQNCLACRKSKNPWTGEFDVVTAHAFSVYQRYYKETAEIQQENLDCDK